jgi:hypothetical protein
MLILILSLKIIFLKVNWIHSPILFDVAVIFELSSHLLDEPAQLMASLQLSYPKMILRFTNCYLRLYSM